MKLNKIILNTVVAAMAFTSMVSCSDDDYSMAPVPNNDQVFFSNEMNTTILLAENQESVNVTISRQKTEGEATIAIEAQDENSIFTVPSSVSFAAGKATAEIPVTFKFSDLTPDTDYKLTLNIKDNASEYGITSLDVIIKYAPWTDWAPFGWEYASGIKTFEQFETVYAKAQTYNEVAKGGILPVYTYNAYYSGNGTQIFFMRQSQLNPSQVQFMLYDWGSGINLILDYNKATGEFTCPETYLTNNANYGAVYVSDPVAYRHGKLGKDESYADYPSEYDKENGKFTLYLAYYVSAGWFGAGPEFLQLPGFEKADYSLTLMDEGAFQSKAIMAEVVNMTMGADVASVKYAVFGSELSEEMIDEVAEMIFSGEVESTLTTESGYKLIPVDDEGDYTIVAVLYDAEGNRVGENVAMNFTYKKPTAEETWTPVAAGTYTYPLLAALFKEDPYVQTNMILYQSDANPNSYKIGEWGFEAQDFTFTWDGSAEVTVGTDILAESQNNLYCGELGVLVGSTNYGWSSFDNTTSTFNFNVGYYIGSSIYKYGIETFVVTGAAQSRSAVVSAFNNANTSARQKKTVAKVNLDIKKALRISK